MDIKKMEIFCLVAEDLNMTKVAKKIYITQSAVSQCIMDVEKELGKPLFERLNNKLYLLSEGQLFYDYTKRIINLFYESKNQINGTAQLKLGASTTIGIYVLPDYIKRFSKQNRACDITLKIENTSDILKMLQQNEIDMAFVEGMVSEPEIISEVIWSDLLLFICSRESNLANKCIDPSGISKHKFIFREKGSGTRQILENAFSKAGITVSTMLEFGNSEAIKKAVEADMGISCISEKAISREIRYGNLSTFQVENLAITRYFYLLHHKDKMLSPQSQEFIRLCKSSHK